MPRAPVPLPKLEGVRCVGMAGPDCVGVGKAELAADGGVPEPRCCQRAESDLERRLLELFSQQLAAFHARTCERLERRLADVRDELLRASAIDADDRPSHRWMQGGCDGRGEAMWREVKAEEVVVQVPGKDGGEADAESHWSSADLDDYRRKRQASITAMAAAASSSSMESTEAAPSRCGRLIRSPRFEAFFAFATAASAVLMGIQADYDARPWEVNASMALGVLSSLFSILFMVELVCNMWYQGRGFYTSRDRRAWNLFDLVLVMLSLPELVMFLSDAVSHIFQGSNVGQVRMLRILRITRLARILRIARVVRSIRALRTLVYQIMGTMRSLIWGMALLVLLLYGFGIVFTQMATALLAADNVLSQEDTLALLQYWSSVLQSMFTLFQSVTGGVTWDEALRPLSYGGVTCVMLFSIYIAFTQLAVLNVLTGVFCNSAMESAKLDQDIATQTMLANKKSYVKQLHDLFREIDADGSGTLTILELQRHLQNERVRAYFEHLDIDVSDVWTVFLLMDENGDHTLDLEEFVEGCMSIRGQAKKIDVRKLGKEHRRFCRRYEADMCSLHEMLAKLGGIHFRRPRP